MSTGGMSTPAVGTAPSAPGGFHQARGASGAAAAAAASPESAGAAQPGQS
jgi:hypothetical protein